MQNRESYAVSEVLGLALVLMIITGAISMILFWGVPQMQDQKAIVALESTLLQLDAMGDIMDDVFSEGSFCQDINADPYYRLFGGSKTMSFKLGGGDISLDEKGERFVLWYSLARDFTLNVSGFGDENDHEFTVEDMDAGNLELYIYYLDETYNPDKPDRTVNNVNKGDIINIEDDTFSDARRIDFFDPGGVPGFRILARIWLFDVGSLTYTSAGSSATYEAIMENGGVLSTSGDVSRYFFNEPKYWPQLLQDEDSELLIFRFIQLKKNPDSEAESIGGTGSGIVNFEIKAKNSTILESKTPIVPNGVGGPHLNLLIYGNEGAVSAWRFFYIYRMNFEGEVSNLNEPLTWEPSSLTIDNVYFSLNHAICYFSMEGES